MIELLHFATLLALVTAVAAFLRGAITQERKRERECVCVILHFQWVSR